MRRRRRRSAIHGRGVDRTRMREHPREDCGGEADDGQQHPAPPRAAAAGRRSSIDGNGWRTIYGDRSGALFALDFPQCLLTQMVETPRIAGRAWQTLIHMRNRLYDDPSPEGNSPGFSQLDLQLITMLRRTERFFVSLRAEAFNLFNHAILANPDAVLPDALLDYQPGSPCTSDFAAGFGLLTSTLGRTVGLETSRQVQLAVRFQF